jgi:hypothetical protein
VPQLRPRKGSRTASVTIDRHWATGVALADSCTGPGNRPQATDQFKIVKATDLFCFLGHLEANEDDLNLCFKGSGPPAH